MQPERPGPPEAVQIQYQIGDARWLGQGTAGPDRNGQAVQHPALPGALLEPPGAQVLIWSYCCVTSKETLTSEMHPVTLGNAIGRCGLYDQSSANVSYYCLNYGKLPFYMDKSQIFPMIPPNSINHLRQ